MPKHRAEILISDLRECHVVGFTASLVIPCEGAKRRNMGYNEAGVKALDKVREVIDSVGLPLIKARKFNGILNAIEMQIEDYEYADEVVKALDRALLALDWEHVLTWNVR